MSFAAVNQDDFILDQVPVLRYVSAGGNVLDTSDDDFAHHLRLMQPTEYRAQDAGGNYDDHQGKEDMQQDAWSFHERRCFGTSRRFCDLRRKEPESGGSNQKKNARHCHQTCNVEKDDGQPSR